MNGPQKMKKNMERLWTLFYFGIKSPKIEHTFKTHD